jgi:hypothetical protein
MKTDYNRTHHLELLKRKKDCENCGKIFHREEYENFVQFIGYNGAICDYFHWKNRFKLASLLEEFINGTISGETLRSNLILFKRKVNILTDKLTLELDSEKFENFNPDFYRLIDFSEFISFLDDEFDDFSHSYEDKDFYLAIKKIFLELQKVLDETEVFAGTKVFDERTIFAEKKILGERTILDEINEFLDNNED